MRKKIFKQIISGVLAVIIVMGLSVSVFATDVAGDLCFLDIDIGSEYITDIDRAYRKGFVEPRNHRVFGQYDYVTRADLAHSMAMVLNAYLPNYENEYPFADVGEDNPYHAEIAWMAHTELMNGVGDNFYPDEFLTYEEICTVIYRLMKNSPRANYIMKAPNITDADIEAWALEEVIWCIRTGFIKEEESYYSVVKKENLCNILMNVYKRGAHIFVKNKVHPDLDETSQGFLYIQNALDKGFIEAYGSVFYPDMPIFVYDFFNALAKLQNVDLNDYELEETYMGMDPGDRGSKATAWALKEGILGELNPRGTLSKLDAFKILYNEYKDIVPMKPVSDNMEFVSEENREVIQWAIGANLLLYDNYLNIAENNLITRAEVCWAISRIELSYLVVD